MWLRASMSVLVGRSTVKVDGGIGLIDGEAQGFRNQIMKARGDI